MHVSGDFNGTLTVDNVSLNSSSDRDGYVAALDAESLATTAGSSVNVQFSNASVTFTNVLSSGDATLNPLDPNSQGAPPAGYSIEGPAYNLDTAATTTGTISVCINVSNVIIE